ncbi:MAG TPA: hypothetical protein VHA56_13715 [Mucilaginibacter sp.]|nr:hypothetical protein [Mucilaginibacter sp.]
MSILLILLEIIAAIILIVLFAAIMVKKEYAVQRQIVISKNSSDIFGYIRMLKNQQYYSKWVMMDPDAKKKNLHGHGWYRRVYLHLGQRE